MELLGPGHMDVFCLTLNLTSGMKREETSESCQIGLERKFENPIEISKLKKKIYVTLAQRRVSGSCCSHYCQPLH